MTHLSHAIAMRMLGSYLRNLLKFTLYNREYELKQICFNLESNILIRMRKIINDELEYCIGGTFKAEILDYFIDNPFAFLAPYCRFPKKPTIKVEE